MGTRFGAALAAALAIASLSTAAPAQDFPVKPVTLIVPFPAGGATDIVMRALAESTQKHLGQPIVIENKSGASGTLGPAQMAANAKPDGYTIAQIPITVFRIPFMTRATYDPAKDFTYVIGLTG
jgi:tripartite-type tricarboxylate transporter receptor subunit TctC